MKGSPLRLGLGVATRASGELGVALRIDDSVVDLAQLAQRATDPALRGLADVLSTTSLNPLMALGDEGWGRCRRALSRLGPEVVEPVTRAAADVEPIMPFQVGDFVDFYTSHHHAVRAGQLMRPGSRLTVSWPYVPLGYHSRAGSVSTESAVRRPWGQFRIDADPEPVFQPTRKLDFELELGFVVGMPSDGRPVPVKDALRHVFGVVLLSDWSARDIQAYEAQPLGPFLGKAFATTIAGWVTPLDHVAAQRSHVLLQSPAPLGHLRMPVPSAYDLDLTVELRPAGSAAGAVICRSNARYSYWSAEQLVAHLTSGGARLRTGDLLGTGTLSGPAAFEGGSLLELASNGQQEIDVVGTGVRRRYLEDGDELSFSTDSLFPLTAIVVPALPELVPIEEIR